MIKRILVPVDFSAPSLQALDYAIGFGRPLKAELTILHVVEPIYFAMPNGYGVGYDAGILLREIERSGREQLSRTAARLRARGVAARTLQSVGTPHQTIVDTAKKLKSDLIVMATHGRSGLSHLVMGSVAERVVRSATCPVLVIRAGKGRATTRRAAKAKRAASRRSVGRRQLRLA